MYCAWRETHQFVFGLFRWDPLTMKITLLELLWLQRLSGCLHAETRFCSGKINHHLLVSIKPTFDLALS